jgi:DNA-binding transcriptional LysR family regulator
MTPTITLEALIVLDTIDSRGSYAAAAEQLNKVPSALSYIVQKLEEQLNVTIFQRQGRKAVLTPAGKHLLAEGRKMLNAINKLSEQTQTIANGWEPKIRIAIDTIIDAQVIFDRLYNFIDQYPNIELDVSEEVLNGSWESLIEDNVDLLIGASDPVPSQKGIRAVKMCELNIVFVVSHKHPLAAAKQAISKQNISQYRTVVIHDSAKSAIPRSADIIENSQHFFVQSMHHKVQAIVAGIGCGYVPKHRIQPYLDDGQLIELDLLESPKKKDLYLAWKLTNRGKGLLQLVKLFDGVV